MIKKEVIYFLNNKKRHIGEYFEVKYFKNKYFLYFNSENTIQLCISDTLNFTKSNVLKVLNNASGGCFCIIHKDVYLYMLCGCHVSNKESNEIHIPDLVWPQEKRTILDWKIKRKDRKNGMYLLRSSDGIHWEELLDKPVLHSYIKSFSCKLGEVCFDTHPCLVKFNDEYHFYGRLNSSLDERRIYLRKSNDLINWSLPEKINIKNENKGNFKNNYYNFVVYIKDNKLYSLSPYFEACGTEARVCKNGKTLLLESVDGLNWTIIKSFFPHVGKYKDRVNSVLINDNIQKIFFRENCIDLNQNLISVEFN